MRMIAPCLPKYHRKPPKVGTPRFIRPRPEIRLPPRGSELKKVSWDSPSDSRPHGEYKDKLWTGIQPLISTWRHHGRASRPHRSRHPAVGMSGVASRWEAARLSPNTTLQDMTPIVTRRERPRPLHPRVRPDAPFSFQDYYLKAFG